MTEGVNEIVSKLQKKDVYSILCSFIYDLKDVPEYAMLSELCYLLDTDSFLHLINYCSGQTIRIPTKEEFSDLVQVLLLFQYYEVEKYTWKDAVSLAGFPPSKGKFAKNKLEQLKKTIKKYNFGNRNY